MKVVYWILGILTTLFIVFVVILCLFIYGGLDHNVWHTYYGTVNIDTLEIGFNDFNDHEPCYKVHTEINGNDTTDYYFYNWKGIYYKSVKDSLGRRGYVIIDPYNNTSVDYIHYIKE